MRAGLLPSMRSWNLSAAYANSAGMPGSAAVMSARCPRTASRREDIISAGASSSDLGVAGAATPVVACCCFSQSCTLGSAKRFSSAWISAGVALSPAGAERFAAAADAATVPESTVANRIIAARQPLRVRKIVTPTAEDGPADHARLRLQARQIESSFIKQNFFNTKGKSIQVGQPP